jgi:hypothetical protein
VSKRTPNPPAVGVFEPIPVCCWKIGWASAGEARYQAARSARSRGEQLRPYTCPACGQWHLTSRNDTSHHQRHRDLVIRRQP